VTLRDVLRRSDPLLAGSTLLLALLGLLLLWTGRSNAAFHDLFVRQTIFLVLGIMTFLFASRVHYAVSRALVPVVYVLLLVLLVIALQGEAIRGAASWIALGTLRIQPSELAKVILVLVMAKVLSERRQGRIGGRTLLLSLAYAAVPIALVVLQPDVGTAALLILTWFGMVLVAGITRRQLVGLLAIGVIVSASAWFLLLREYQKDRLRTFLNPRADPLGAGYTVLQSVTALGSGGLVGRGLGYGPQSRLNFLPEHHTDFIFARVGEELGFIGVAGVLSLYGIILARTLAAARRTSDPFGRALAAGAFLALLSGVTVNAGMNLGLLPVTGVPLPLVSYGGSSLVSTFLLLGIVESVLIHGEQWAADEGEGLLVES
jgi:rod shape determining protein RodA